MKLELRIFVIFLCYFFSLKFINKGFITSGETSCPLWKNFSNNEWWYSPKQYSGNNQRNTKDLSHRNTNYFWLSEFSNWLVILILATREPNIQDRSHEFLLSLLFYSLWCRIEYNLFRSFTVSSSRLSFGTSIGLSPSTLTRYLIGLSPDTYYKNM